MKKSHVCKDNSKFSIKLLLGGGGDFKMAKISRGGRMTAAKRRAKSGRPGGKGMVKNRPAGKNIMST